MHQYSSVCEYISNDQTLLRGHNFCCVFFQSCINFHTRASCGITFGIVFDFLANILSSVELQWSARSVLEPKLIHVLKVNCEMKMIVFLLCYPAMCGRRAVYMWTFGAGELLS